MSKKYNVLDTVKSSFNLHDHGRSDGNNRNYLVAYAQRMTQSPKFLERQKLRELYGYYGHTPRQLANKMELDEIEVVMLNGKPVVMTNIPSNVTTELTVSDDGIVTHTEEILDTPTGRAVKAMNDAGVGGWSWSIDGNYMASGSVARQFFGFDYVKHPSYIDTEKQQAMFESCGVSNQQELLEHNLIQQGFDPGQSGKIIALFESRVPTMDEFDALNQNIMFMESLITEKDSALVDMTKKSTFRESAFNELLKASPVMMSQRQIDAFARMGSAEDKEIVSAFFESLAAGFETLPMGVKRPAHVDERVERKPYPDDVMEGAVFFDSSSKANPFR